MRLYRAGLVIVVLAALSACVPSSASIIENVVKKLDEFATTDDLKESGLSKEELLACIDEWNSLPEDMKAKNLEVPQYKLLYHFGILPTERISSQLDNMIISKAHIRRFEEAYKRFRPAFLGAAIEDFWITNIRAQKLWLVFNKLKSHKPCTLNDFLWLKEEHSAWLDRYEDIVTNEDVYANMDELRAILNYQNCDLVKPLFYDVLPLLGQVKNPAVLQQLYYDKLFETTNIEFLGDTLAKRNASIAEFPSFALDSHDMLFD